MEDTGTFIGGFSKNYSTVQPTMNLKFIDGILHQEFSYTDHKDEDVFHRLVWKPVPSETTEKTK